MSFESNQAIIIDEIDRLFVVYGKAKDYITKIAAGIDDQMGLWENRRKIILDQMKPSSSLDFLLPKTQRINELTIEAVQALCRVDLLIEQILRIDPKLGIQPRPIPTSISLFARSNDSNVLHPTTNIMSTHFVPSPLLNFNKQQTFSNGKTLERAPFPTPVLRSQQQTPSNRSAMMSTSEKTGFKPIEQQQSSIISDNTSRPTPIHPQTSQYAATEKSHSVLSLYARGTPQLDHISPPVAGPTTTQMNSNIQPPREKVSVKLQRIPPGTTWRKAKIEVIDSLSVFYVENFDAEVHEKFSVMFNDLHDYYSNLERKKCLIPLENLSIGDFGVAKYSKHKHWCRARILTAQDSDQISIVFIDFGNSESKSINEFFPLHQVYTALPAQAIACTLSQAFPRTPVNNGPLWPLNTVDIFREEVTNKDVVVTFVDPEEGTKQWPLHFVTITVGNQTVTTLLNLQQRIEPKPNRYIAEQLAPSLTHQAYILFNVRIDDDEHDQQIH